MKNPSPLRIRLLGELQLVRGDGGAAALPASKKTRALLGYLIATGQAHRRERLCDLFWDGPDDPRAELRWSLSKIRPLLDSATGVRLAADRERIAIDTSGAVVDLALVRARLGSNASGAPTDALKEAAALFGGEFLDGLDLPLCYRYQEWCMAERESVSRLRLTVLATLVQRLQGQPADALPYAHSLTAADPLSESGHAAVVRLLLRLGRTREALSHYEHASRVFEAELGEPPSAELAEAGRALRSRSPTSVSAGPDRGAPNPVPSPARPASSAPAMIGRDAERAIADRVIAATANRRLPDVLLVTGEPGIGKSRMLVHIGERMTAGGGCAFGGRSFEAELARSYGIWIDLLRAIVRERAREGLPANLRLLLPELDGTAGDPGNRMELFDAVLDLLRTTAAERPMAIALDDVQWMDEASSSLLHYVARHLRELPGLLIVCAARAGEIEDNAGASRILRSLAREGQLQDIELAALSAAETAELVRRIDPALDAARIFAESDGNPLFALELARAQKRGETGPGRTVEGVIAGQLAALTDQVRDTLVWAAAHGRAFTPDDLARVARLDTPGLLAALGEVERRGLVRPVGGEAYDFAHDLVRQTAYRSLSQPRRKLLHRHIARALEGAARKDGAWAADLVHHAALADDHAMAARACIRAGEQALRLFANAEAEGFAERGLRHAERLADGPEKLEFRIALLKIRVLAAAGPGLRSLPPLAGAVAAATRAAEAQGLQAAAATGHYLLSVLHQEAGDAQQAQRSTLRAADVGRAADDTTQAHQFANTARCLLELETEIGRSRELIAEARALADARGLVLCELHWALGLLARWDGNEDQAVSSLARALALARRDQDRWREYKCLTWLAMLELERGRYAEMHARCAELKVVAAKVGEDETPFVETLWALAALATAMPAADTALASALARLRAVDDKSYLAYALNAAALVHRRAGRLQQARLHASEALNVASVMRRRNEIVIAEAMLTPAAGEKDSRNMDDSVPTQLDPDDLSARARSALLGAAAAPWDSNEGSHAGPAELTNRPKRN